MPRKLLKRYIPDPQKFSKIKGVSYIAHWLQDPNLWHLNRASVAKAFFIGLFWMAIPIPWQMLVAALSAILLRANLALSVMLVWISNPLTMGPIFYFNYRIGSLMLGERARENLNFELSFDWIGHTFVNIWQPLMLGSMVVGIALGSIAYVAIHIIWRMHVNMNWRQRLHLRKDKLVFKKPRFAKPLDAVHKPDHHEH